MKPIQFPEANYILHANPENENSVQSLPAFITHVGGGPFDGSLLTVVAWQPSPEDIEALQQGNAVFLSFLGQVPPHSVAVSFEELVKT